MTCKRWLLVRSQPRRERTAEDNLGRQGVLIYCPRYVQRGNEFAVFPSYLFAFTDAVNTEFIDSTRGVSRRVRIGGELAVVPQYAIDTLKARQNENGYFVLTPRVELHPGMLVRSRFGAFAGFNGICEEMLPGERVAVLFSLFGRQSRTIVDRDMVEAA
jgi:transcription antitermination factor NusG